MKRHRTIGSMSVLKTFALLYPICPKYFYIAGLSVRDLILSLTALFLLLLKNGIIIKNNTKPLFAEILVWSVITATLQLIHAEWVSIFTQLVLWIGIVFFGSSIINTREKFISIIDTVIICSIIVGAFGVVEEITHFNIFSLLNTIGVELNYNPLRLGILRIISFTSHAISYGCYCMIILGLIIYRISIEKKSFLYVAGALMLINEFFTLSRVSMIGVLIELILILWFSGHQRAIKMLIRGSICIVIVVAIIYLISERARAALTIAGYVILALFDDSYVSVLTGLGFSDNVRGIGNRIDLYKWVYEETKNNLLLGNGAYTPFEHSFINSRGYLQTKNSIEVQWLRTFFRYGLIGLISEVYMYIMLIVHAFNRRIKNPSAWEGQISFTRLVSVILICYIFSLFGVMQNEDVQLFSLVIMLLIAYVQNKGFSKTMN